MNNANCEKYIIIYEGPVSYDITYETGIGPGTLYKDPMPLLCVEGPVTIELEQIERKLHYLIIDRGDTQIVVRVSDVFDTKEEADKELFIRKLKGQT